MQTDPNFGNYLWRPQDGRIALLDFGAVRPVLPESAQAYRALLQAILSGTIETVRAALLDMGYLSPGQVARHGPTLDDMTATVLDYVLRPRTAWSISATGGRWSPCARGRNPSLPTGRSGRSVSGQDVPAAQDHGMALLALKLKVRLPVVDMLSEHA